MPRSAREAETIVRLELRLPKELHAVVVTTARTDDRSMNGEIIVLLREALAARAKRRR